MKTQSEKDFKRTLKGLNGYIALSLYPMDITISKEPTNQARINEGRLGIFDGVSEEFYDRMVTKFDSRYKNR
jgi:hypothetical protein